MDAYLLSVVYVGKECLIKDTVNLNMKLNQRKRGIN